MSYYRLSAYGIGLKNPSDPEQYLPGVTLDHIYGLYRFDAHIRNLLITLIEEIEVELRARISYHLAIIYGSEGFRDSDNFADIRNRDGESVHQKTIEKFDKEVAVQKNLPCVIHHQKKYGGHFPVWAAIELFTFGMLSSLYSVMK